MKDVLKFGTDGIRGNAYQFPFDQKSLFVLGYVIGYWYTQSVNAGMLRGNILIGCDTRESGERIKQDLYAGLSAFPYVCVDGGIMPTPAVFSLVSKGTDFGLGIVISASHNPYADNGIKLFKHGAGKLSLSDEQEIETLFSIIYARLDQDSVRVVLGSLIKNYTLNERYKHDIAQRFKPNYLQGLKIVVDCAYGAMSDVAPSLFETFGAVVMSLHTAYTGFNINEQCGATHVDVLKNIVIQEQADYGIAFDGDGDRVVIVNVQGDLADGDDIIAILLDLPAYADERAVVSTIMANLGFEKYLAERSISLIRTSVGDKYVVASMEEQKILLGGEPSGHIIIGDYANTGDGLFVGLKTLEALLVSRNYSLKRFIKWPQVLQNIPVVNKKNLNDEPFVSLIAEYKKKLEGGRLIVRYSGTENIVRVMAEGVDFQVTTVVAQELVSRLQLLLNQPEQLLIREHV